MSSSNHEFTPWVDDDGERSVLCHVCEEYESHESHIMPERNWIVRVHTSYSYSNESITHESEPVTLARAEEIAAQASGPVAIHRISRLRRERPITPELREAIDRLAEQATPIVVKPRKDLTRKERRFGVKEKK